MKEKLEKESEDRFVREKASQEKLPYINRSVL